jgi:hypothetical protein
VVSAAITVALGGASKPPSRRSPHRGGSRLQAYLLVMALLAAIWAITGAGYF